MAMVLMKGAKKKVRLRSIKSIKVCIRRRINGPQNSRLFTKKTAAHFLRETDQHCFSYNFKKPTEIYCA